MQLSKHVCKTCNKIYNHKLNNKSPLILLSGTNNSQILHFYHKLSVYLILSEMIFHVLTPVNFYQRK